MSHHANIWLVLRDDAQTLIVDRLRHKDDTGDYVGPVPDRAHRIFKWMSDYGNIQRLFKTVTIGGRQYKLWNLTVPETKNAREELDWLTAEFPSQIFIVGAWRWNDGAQAGTRNIYSTRIVEKTWSIRNPDHQPDPELPNFDDRYIISVTGDVEEIYISGHTGTPMYPLHARLADFMPRPFIEDVNLGMGQAPRVFV